MPFAGLHVPAAHLAEHLDVARQLCTPVTLSQIVDAIEGRSPLPPRAVHFTFDDGYRSVLTRALPLIERADVPASVFVCASPSRNGTAFWYDAMAREHGDREVVALRDGGQADWEAVVARWSPPVKADDELATLTGQEVAALGAHPLVEIGSHTGTHLPLAQIPAERQRTEIAAGIDCVAEWTGRRPRAFAYPIGRPDHDYDAQTMRLVREAGVSVAFTTAPGWCAPGRPALEQPRFVMVDGLDGAELANRLAWHWRP
jgi:peptidoglycan/xylan/chitin deacetylase (PgdA/CDA1 family)